MPDLERVDASEEILDSFDIERIDLVTLLFQAGYLTIDHTRNPLGLIEIKVRRPAGPVQPATVSGSSPGTPGASPSIETNPALAQISAGGDSAKYRALPRRGLFELGLVFDSQDRNLAQADGRVLT